MNCLLRKVFVAAAFLFVLAGVAVAQRSQTLFGDIKIDESGIGNSAPPRVMLILYKDVGGEVGRQAISNGSRYTFTNLNNGDYQIAIEVDNIEIGRLRVVIGGLSNDPHGFRQDLDFALKPRGSSGKPGIISAADTYERPTANKALFQKAQEAAGKKKFDQATDFLKQIVAADKADFQAWTLLGTIYLTQEKSAEAEQAYLNAIAVRPTFALALIDLGRLRSTQKRFSETIEPLTQALAAQPESGEANLLLGEAYLQLKQGSKAVPFLRQAAGLGKPEAHLRLGWLYNAAGMKDQAALEYEEFLKKKPDYSDRKRLEEYIAANKK